MQDNIKHILFKWSIGGTIAIGFLGFVFSYMTLWIVAKGFQMNWAQVVIFPLLLDLLMVVAHLVYFYLHVHNSEMKLVTWAMYGSVALSVAFNLSHANWSFAGQLWDGQNAKVMLSLIAWSLPPIALLVCVKMISKMVATEMGLRFEDAKQAQPIAIKTQSDAKPVLQPLQPAQTGAKPMQADAMSGLAPDEREPVILQIMQTRNGDVTHSYLADFFDVAISTIGRQMNAMVKKGLLQGNAKDGYRIVQNGQGQV